MKTSFLQQSRFGRVVFDLDNQKLHVTGKRGVVRIELDVDLRDLSPHFERRKWRSPSMIVIPFGIACTCGLVVWLVPFLLVTVIAVMFCIGFLWTAIRNVTPIELVTFRSKSGVPVFEVIKDERQAAEFERFVTELVSAIRASAEKVEV